MTTPQYTITIRKTARGTFSFRYVGELSIWKRLCIRAAGWSYQEAA